MLSRALVPPCSLSTAPLPSPLPGVAPPAGAGPEREPGPLHLCPPSHHCPDCQPHTDVPRGREGGCCHLL